MGQQLFMKLMHVNRRLTQHFNKRLKPYNIKLSHFRVLHHIYMNEGASQNELADLIGIDKITMTKLVEKLVQEGYVEKRTDREDKRYNSVYTTEVAKEKQEDLSGIISDLNGMLQNILTDEESGVVLNLLDRLIVYVEDEME